MEGEALGRYEPAGDYIPQTAVEVANKLMAQDMREEAYELLALSLEYATRLGYAARLIGHEVTDYLIDKS